MPSPRAAKSRTTLAAVACCVAAAGIAIAMLFIPSNTALPIAIALLSLIAVALLAVSLRRSELTTTNSAADVVFNAVSAHLAILDNTGRIIRVNQAWRDFGTQNGLGDETFSVGTNYLGVCESARGDAADEAPDIGAGIRLVINNQAKTYFHEYPCHSPDQERWFQIRVARFEEHGEPMVLVAHENITETRIAQRRIIQQLDSLSHAGRISLAGEMASGLAHELNQPLAAIRNYVSGCKRLLDQPDPKPARLADALNHLDAQADRAAEIVKRWRGFVSKTPVARKATDLREVIASAVALTDHELKGSSATIDLFMPDQGAFAYADSVQLQQVIVNLIVNACEAASETTDKPQIRIELEDDPDRDGFIVRCLDNGPGIPEDMTEQIFAPFLTTKNNGMGLGLPICRSIIEQHGGRLWSEPPGTENATLKGTVLFTMPRHSENARTQEGTHNDAA